VRQLVSVVVNCHIPTIDRTLRCTVCRAGRNPSNANRAFFVLNRGNRALWSFSIPGASTLFPELTHGVLIRVLLLCRQVTIAVHARIGKLHFE